MPNGNFKFHGITAAANYLAFHPFSHKFNLTQVSFFNSAEQCLQLINSNFSDVSNSLVSHSQTCDSFSVPVPFFPRQIYILTGYNLTDYKLHLNSRLTSVMSNLKIFRAEVYLLLFLLLAVVLVLVVVKVKFYSKNFRKNHKSFTFVLKRRKLKLRFIYFLLNVLFLLLYTHFTIMYNSQQVVKIPPKVIDSFDKLLNEKSVAPVFFDSLFRDSYAFKWSEINSIKHRVWEKSLKSEGNVVSGVGLEISLDRLNALAVKVISQKGVLITSRQTMLLVNGLLCSLSPEGEIWKTIMKKHESENEKLVGWVTRKSFKYEAYMFKFFRRLCESDIIRSFFEMIKTDYGYIIKGTSRSHRLEQKRVCQNTDIVRGTSDKFTPPSLKFFASYGYILIAILLLAVVRLYFEHLSLQE